MLVNGNYNMKWIRGVKWREINKILKNGIGGYGRLMFLLFSFILKNDCL